jgi:TolB-like protein/Tfp pilus assembly protein PilF
MKQEVDSALRLAPNDGYMVMIAALLQTDMDWLEEAEATFQRAIEINPREPKVFYNYFTLLTKKGDVAKARWASDRSLELAPESVYFRLNRAEEEFLWTGQAARTKKFLAEIPAGKDPDGRVTAAHCWVAVYERNFPEALRLLAACPSERLPSFVCRFGNMVPKGFLEGWIHFYAGDKERAYTALDSVRWTLEMEAKEDPGDQGAHFGVAMAYAAMGWNDAALAEIARTKEKPDAWPMAALLVHAGERDAALRLLEQLPATEREYWYYDLRQNPHWDPLRSDARFEKMLASSQPKTAAVPQKSVAILPFENRSEDKDNAFLADGIQDDVLASLVQIKDLKVIGGSSVMSYRDAANRNLREIGQQLNVAYVLEGSVRRVTNKLLVYVKLTDTRDGRSVWAERYDRTIADSTSLQGEVAADIAGALRATLAPAEKARLQTKTTHNPEAYVLYLRGREYQMRPEVSQDNYLAAENFYKQAVALDPAFVLARARLAEMQVWLYEKFDTQPARLAEARRNAEDAVRVDPDCGQAHMALAGCMKANYATHGKQEDRDGPAAMRREVADAVRLLPNDGYIALAAAMLQWDMEWFDEAAASFERAMVLNPREGKVFYNYSGMLAEKGDIQDIPRSRWASDQALELSPDSIFFRLNRASMEIEWTGEVAPAKAILAGLPAGKDPDGRVTVAHCTIALYERNFTEALRLLAACELERVPFLDGSFVGPFVPKGLVEGLVHFWAGHLQEAYASLNSVRWMLEVEARESAVQAEAHYHLALTYAAMGWRDAAKAEIARAYKKPDPGQMASFFTVLGDYDSAFPLLEQLVSAWRPARTYLRLHPLFDSLRTDPRFEKLLAQNGGTGH